MKLLMTEISDTLWAVFCGWYQTRRLPPPARSKDGVFIITEIGDLVAGCCIFPTEGPIAFVEYFSVSPYQPLRLRHMATAAIVDAVVSYGAMRSKTMLCLVRHQGIHRMLSEGGFLELPLTVMGHSAQGPTGLEFQLQSGEPGPEEDKLLERKPRRRGAKA